MSKQTIPQFDPFQFFQANGTIEGLGKAVLRPMETFWEGQRQILGEYEKLAGSMLRRRRAGTEATIEAVHKMQNCRNPAELAKCCNEWLGGSFARLANDSADMMSEGLKVWTELSQSMAASLSEAVPTEKAAEAGAAAASRQPK